MRSTFRALALLALSGCATERLAGNSDRILLTGRVAPGPTFAWGGTRASVRFLGTGATVTFREAPSPVFEAKLRYRNKYRFLVDGQKTGDVLATPDADGKWSWTSPALSPGEHTLDVIKETEAGVGEAQLVSIAVSGRAKAPPARRARSLEFIGDSHAAGFGALGTDPCPFSPETESHSEAFAAIAADQLSADAHFIVWSGRGLIRNFDDDRLPETVPQMWRRTLPDRPAGWAPDAVVVLVGANDFGRGDPGEPFIPALSAFLRELHATYPRAFVLVLGRAHKPGLTVYLQHVVQERMAGEKWLGFLELPRRTPEEGKGCVSHETVATQKRHAGLVERALAASLGWKPN